MATPTYPAVFGNWCSFSLLKVSSFSSLSIITSPLIQIEGLRMRGVSRRTEWKASSRQIVICDIGFINKLIWCSWPAWERSSDSLRIFPLYGRKAQKSSSGCSSRTWDWQQVVLDKVAILQRTHFFLQAETTVEPCHGITKHVCNLWRDWCHLQTQKEIGGHRFSFQMLILALCRQ